MTTNRFAKSISIPAMLMALVTVATNGESDTNTLVLDQAMRPINIGRGEGTSSCRGGGRMADCTVTINKLTSDGFPVGNMVDGDVNTYVWPAAAQRDTMEVTTVDVVFDAVRRINRIRFLQHRTSYMYAYRILGSEDGATYDKVLVDCSPPNPAIPVGEWIEHGFTPRKLKAIRLVPAGGVSSYPLYKDLCSPPALAEFEAFNDETPLEITAARPVTIGVDVRRTLSVNGHDRIRDTMFAVSNIPRNRELAIKYLADLNLGMITLWPSTLGHVPTDAKGHFDPAYFAPGGGYERDALWESTVCEIARDILKCGVNLRLEKAPPAMRLTGFQSTDPVRDKKTGAVETQFDPPVNPAEWARMAALSVQSLSRRYPETIRSVEMWNEPNTTRYWPVPINEKARRYREFYAAAAPVLRNECPGIAIDGPVTSGGVLGWAGLPKVHDLPFDPHWTQWVKGMVDECGPHLDRFNIHPYGHDADCLRAEARLLANYSTLKLGRAIPLSSSEANASTVFGHPGVDFSTMAWRGNVVPWADFFLPLLKEPDKFVTMTYFYITTGNAWDPCGMFNGWGPSTNDDKAFSAHDPRMFDSKAGRPSGPQPIYYLYKLVRNLRGTLMPVSVSNPEGWNVVAARQGRKINVVIQNRTAHANTVAFNLNLPENVTILSSGSESLEYDVQKGLPTTRTASGLGEAGAFRIEATPFGIYSVTLELDRDDFPVIQSSITSHYGDRVWQTLSAMQQRREFGVRLPDFNSLTGKVSAATLRFGVAGIPFQRPRRIMDRRVPLEVVVNGQSKGVVLAGEFNAIPLNPAELKNMNTVVIHRAAWPDGDSRIVEPRELYVMSVEMETEQ